MRHREKILSNLEDTYRESYDRARKAEDDGQMAALDHDYQRDQLFLEVLLDIRGILATPARDAGDEPEEKEESLLEKAERLRQITRLR